jgi:hypothetical protein
MSYVTVDLLFINTNMPFWRLEISDERMFAAS